MEYGREYGMVNGIHMQQRGTVWERKRKEEKKYIKGETGIEKSSNQVIASSLIWKMYLSKDWKIESNKVWVTNYGHNDNKTKLF